MESLLTGSLGTLARQRTAPLIVELDLSDGILEARPADPLAAVMSRHQPAMTDVLTGLKTARKDDRVKALVVKLGGRPIGLQQMKMCWCMLDMRHQAVQIRLLCRNGYPVLKKKTAR